MSRTGLLVLVCGGRHYHDVTTVYSELAAFSEARQIGCIVQGGATGVDALAKQWAVMRGLPVFTCEAHWNTLGLAAGSIRNRWMAAWMRPDVVIAFPGGDGTADMVKRARSAGIPVTQCPTP